MNSFVPQMEILPLSQQRVWSSLTPVCKARFVLYGGTAVALRLGHRQSIDFDFFSDQPLDKSRIYKMLPILADATVIQETTDLLGLLVPINVFVQNSLLISPDFDKIFPRFTWFLFCCRSSCSAPCTDAGWPEPRRGIFILGAIYLFCRTCFLR